ncbi:MAG: terminase gpA endonuclease subunit [Desulfovibrio sp.]|jgi:phage terminase large subunit GpA-like protein
MNRSFRFTPGERHVFRRRPRVPVSRWAADNLVVPDGPFSGGRFRLDVNPYLAGIMDCWGEPWTEEVVVCGAPQTGKTLAMYACLAFGVEMRPGPRMLAMPDDDTLDRVGKGKLRPLFRACPPIRALLGRATASQIRFRDGTALYLSSAQSPAQRASISVQDLFLDEEALYRQIAGQGVPVLDFVERTRSYAHKRKILRVSKPVGGEDCSIVQAVREGVDELRRFEARCPACMTFQVLEEPGLICTEKCESPTEIRRRRLGRYKCAHCGYLWSDHVRDVAVSYGRWAATEPVARPGRVGFHLPAILSRTVSLSEILAAQAAAEASDSPDEKQAYANGYWAEPYLAAEVAPEQSELLELREPDLAPRTVPREAVALTCGIDMQKRSFYFTVWAWAEGLRSWLVDYGRLRDWEDVLSLAAETCYPREGGGEMPIWRTALDTGGGRTDPGVLTRTEEAYQFLRTHHGYRLHGTKGLSRPSQTPVRWTVIDKMPKSKRPIMGGLTLYLLDVGYFKSLLFGRLTPEARQPARLYDAPEEDLADYLEQLTAERLVRGRDGKLRWERLHRNNHYLDATVLAHACADGSWTPSLQGMILRDKAKPTGRQHKTGEKRAGGRRW